MDEARTAAMNGSAKDWAMESLLVDRKAPGSPGEHATDRSRPGVRVLIQKPVCRLSASGPKRSLFPGKIKDDWQFYAFIGVIAHSWANYAAVNADIRNPRRSPRTAFAGDD